MCKDDLSRGCHARDAPTAGSHKAIGRRGPTRSDCGSAHRPSRFPMSTDTWWHAEKFQVGTSHRVSIGLEERYLESSRPAESIGMPFVCKEIVFFPSSCSLVPSHSKKRASVCCNLYGSLSGMCMCMLLKSPFVELWLKGGEKISASNSSNCPWLNSKRKERNGKTR